MAMRKRKDRPQGGGASKRRKGVPVRKRKYSRVRPSLVRKPLRRVAPRRRVKIAPSGNRAATITVKNGGGGSMFQKRVFKKLRGKKFGLRVLRKLATHYEIHRWQNVNPIDRLTGGGPTAPGEIGAMRIGWSIVDNTPVSSVLSSCNSAVNGFTLAAPGTADTRQIFPVHCMCLNQLNLDGNPALQSPMYVLTQDLDDSAITFTGLYGAPRDTTSTAAQYGWQLEKASMATGSTDPSVLEHPYLRNDWYDIQLTLRNATAQTTYYDIWVVQFKDEWLDPLGTPASPEEIRARRSFWTGLAARNVTHPMLSDPGFAKQMRNIRVLRKYRVVFPNQDGSATDQSPSYKVVRLFYRDGVLNSYMPDSEFRGGTDQNERLQAFQFPNYFNQEVPDYGKVNYLPRALGRKWLIITAFDATCTGSSGLIDSTAISSGGTPSYDIIVRKKVQYPADR